MITAVCFLLIVATVPLLGGRLSRLGQIRLRAWWTIVLALLIQVLLIEVLADTLGGVLAATAHLLSYGFALVFVWHNRKISGMALMVTGGLLNFAAIAANGGVMPAQRSALETAGIIVDSPEFENSAVVDGARLWFLGDIFAIPENVPFANVFSIGDIILVLGGAVTVHTVARSRLGVAMTRLDPFNRSESSDDHLEVPIASYPPPSVGEEGRPPPLADVDVPVAPYPPPVGGNARQQPVADVELPIVSYPPPVGEGERQHRVADVDVPVTAYPPPVEEGRQHPVAEVELPIVSYPPPVGGCAREHRVADVEAAIASHPPPTVGEEDREQRIADLEEQLRQAGPRLELLERLETMAAAQSDSPEALARRAAIDVLRRQEQRHRRKLSALQAEYESLRQQLKKLQHQLAVDFEERLELQYLADLPPPSEHDHPNGDERRRVLNDFEDRYQISPTTGP